MQEDKEPVFDSVDTVKAALAVFAGMLRGTKVNAAACAAAVADPMLLATDVADYLVKRSVPFRKAHEIVGKAVALCTQRGCDLPGLTLGDDRAVSPAFEKDAFHCFDPPTPMAARK